MSTNVQVMVRLRPPIDDSTAVQCGGVRVQGNVAAVQLAKRDHVVRLDLCCAPRQGLNEIYPRAIEPVARAVQNNENGCLLVLGDAKSGKSTLLFGEGDVQRTHHSDATAVVIRSPSAEGNHDGGDVVDTAHLARRPDVASNASTVHRLVQGCLRDQPFVRLTALELDGSVVRDLLHRRAPLRLRETATRRFVADGAVTEDAATPHAAMSILQRARELQSPETSLLLFIDRMADSAKSLSGGKKRICRLAIVELAPTEVLKTSTDPTLMMLASTLESIVTRQRSGLDVATIPQFRNSTLTKLLKSTLITDGCRTTLCHCLHTGPTSARSALAALRFLDRIKQQTARAVAQRMPPIAPPLNLVYDRDGTATLAPTQAPVRVDAAAAKKPVDPAAADDADDEADVPRHPPRGPRPTRLRSIVAANQPAASQSTKGMTIVVGQERRRRNVVETEQSIEIDSFHTLFESELKRLTKKGTRLPPVAPTVQPSPAGAKSARAPLVPKPPPAQAVLTTRVPSKLQHPSPAAGPTQQDVQQVLALIQRRLARLTQEHTDTRKVLTSDEGRERLALFSAYVKEVEEAHRRTRARLSFVQPKPSPAADRPAVPPPPRSPSIASAASSLASPPATPPTTNVVAPSPIVTAKSIAAALKRPVVRHAAAVWLRLLKRHQRDERREADGHFAVLQERRFVAQALQRIGRGYLQRRKFKTLAFYARQTSPLARSSSSLSPSRSASVAHDTPSIPPTPSRSPSPVNQVVDDEVVQDAPRAETPVAPVIEEDVVELVEPAKVFQQHDDKPRHDETYDDDPFVEEYID